MKYHMKTLAIITLTMILLSGVVDAGSVKKPTITSFSVDKTSGTVPLSVVFTSKTTGATSYYWTFIPVSGDKGGDWNSHHAVTAKHIFTTPGKYTITLTVTNSAGSATMTKKAYINAIEKPVPPVAIIGDPMFIYTPGAVHFYDLSTGHPTKWMWNFGDGQISTQQNPIHFYTKHWSYLTISLTVWNSAGMATTTDWYATT